MCQTAKSEGAWPTLNNVCATRMPPLGWRKPPGGAAYGKRPKSKKSVSRKQAAAKRALASAGPHLLKNMSTDEQSDADNEDTAPMVDAAVTSDVQTNGEDVLERGSARLRLQKGAPPYAGLDSDAPSEPDSEGFEAVEGDDSDDDEEREPVVVSPVNKSRTAARAARERVVQSEDEDVAEPLPQQTPPEDIAPLLSVFEISVTLSKQKGHVPSAWLLLLEQWMDQRCEGGCAVLERGGKQENLHLQIMLRMKIAAGDTLIPSHPPSLHASLPPSLYPSLPPYLPPSLPPYLPLSLPPSVTVPRFKAAASTVFMY